MSSGTCSNGANRGADQCQTTDNCKQSDTVTAIVDLQMNVVQTCSEVINAVNDKDKRVGVLETYICDLQNKLDEKEQSLTDLRNKLRCLQNEICEIKKNYGVCETRTQYYADRMQKLEDELARSKEDNEKLQRQVNCCGNEKDKLSCKLERCTKEKDDLNDQLNKLMTELENLNASRNCEVSRLQTMIAEKETMLKKCCVCNKDKSAQLTKQKKDLDDMSSEIGRLNDAKSNLEETLKNRVAAFEEELEQKDAQLSECYNATGDVNDRLQKIMQDLNDMKSQSDDLERECNALQNQKQDLQLKLDEKDSAFKDGQRLTMACNNKAACLEKEVKQLRMERDELEREIKCLKRKNCELKSKADACNVVPNDCDSFDKSC